MLYRAVDWVANMGSLDAISSMEGAVAITLTCIRSVLRVAVTDRSVAPRAAGSSRAIGITGLGPWQFALINRSTPRSAGILATRSLRLHPIDEHWASPSTGHSLTTGRRNRGGFREQHVDPIDKRLPTRLIETTTDSSAPTRWLGLALEWVISRMWKRDHRFQSAGTPTRSATPTSGGRASRTT